MAPGVRPPLATRPGRLQHGSRPGAVGGTRKDRPQSRHCRSLGRALAAGAGAAPCNGLNFGLKERAGHIPPALAYMPAGVNWFRTIASTGQGVAVGCEDGSLRL